MNLDLGKLSISGSVKIDIKRGQTGKVESTGWFDNLITNGGKNILIKGTTDINKLSIGEGNIEPSPNDTNLTNFFISVNRVSVNPSFSIDPDGLGYSRTTLLKFTLEGSNMSRNINISELGLATHQDPLNDNYSLITHVLIKDDLGQNTTISVNTTDSLDIYYKLKYNIKYQTVKYDLELPYNPTENKNYKVIIARDKRWHDYFPSSGISAFNTIPYAGSSSRSSGLAAYVINKAAQYETDNWIESNDSDKKYRTYTMSSTREEYLNIVVESGKKYLEAEFTINKTDMEKFTKITGPNLALAIIPYYIIHSGSWNIRVDRFNAFYIIIEKTDNDGVLQCESGYDYIFKLRMDVSEV